MKGYIYLIESKNHKYLGSTSNVEVRLSEHHQGVTTSTRSKGPWNLLALWEFDTLQEARQVEYRIKRMKRKLFVETVSEFVNFFRKN